MKTNLFFVFTPFQEYVVDKVIQQYFSIEKNIIIISSNPLKISQSSEYLVIRRNLFSLIDLKLAKTKINQLVESETSICFFIPHIGSLLTNYVFSTFFGKVPFSIYYEGIALFYNPKIKLKAKTELYRKVLSKLLGINYKTCREIIPLEIRNCCDIYTPIIELTDGDNLKKINLDVKTNNKYSEQKELLIIGSPLNNKNFKSEMMNVVQNIEKLRTHNYGLIYYKPHYETFISDKKIINYLKSTGNTVLVLDKKKPIELLIDEINFSFVFSNNFSSALVQLKLMYKENIISFISNQKTFSNISSKLIEYFKINVI